MNPLHRATMADRGAEPSPARPQAAAFELPAELRAASPSTSDIVVLGLECWEGARPADPTARFLKTIWGLVDRAQHGVDVAR